MASLMKHDTIEERRDQLKATDLDKYNELRAIRYALFRVRTFLEGGSAPEASHMDIAKIFEDQVVSLGGLVMFAERWDIDPLSRVVVERDLSVWDVHEQKMQRIAVPLPLRDRVTGELIEDGS